MVACLGRWDGTVVKKRRSLLLGDAFGQHAAAYDGCYRRLLDLPRPLWTNHSHQRPQYGHWYRGCRMRRGIGGKRCSCRRMAES